MEEKSTILDEKPLQEGRPFFPNHIIKEVMWAYIIIGVVLTLAIFSPFPLHEKANPFVTPEGIKPEWYFLAGYQFLKYVPKVIGIIGIGIGIVVFFLIPFIDKRPYRHPKNRKGMVRLAIAVLVIAVIFGILGTLSESTKTILGKKIHFDLRGMPHQAVEEPKEK
jgi:quinol-cytochrome oxidoreductase complex cytochrome b subunit